MKNNLDTLAGYKNKIVDLSRRNRLLKFPKTSKSINFDITLKNFLHQFGSLDDFRIEFVHRELLSEQNDADLEEEIVEVPPTNLQGEKLINLLNTLRLETKRKFEEHGLHTLFLTIGKVKWKEPSIGKNRSTNIINEYDYNAPLLLVPVHIEEKKVPKRTAIFTHLEISDISVNKILSLYLEKEYNSRQLEIVQEDTPNWLKTYAQLCKQIKEVFTELNLEFEISDEIQVGQYSFYGQQIYADLHNNEDSIIQHQFINALCAHSQIQQENLDVNIENPDALLSVEKDFNVMEADISQLRVMENAINGNHMNIQGPPGTGKSQTIVNLIANFLARKKSILMVCEKQVGLQVVLERLKTSGLDKLCLPLFHYNADKKKFAKSIVEDRDYIVRRNAQTHKESNLTAALTKRTDHINQLRNYAKILGEIILPLNKSLHWVHGEFTKHRAAVSDIAFPWAGKDPLIMDYNSYKRLMKILENITPVYNIAHDKKVDHWKHIRRQYFTPDFVNRVNKVLEDIGMLAAEVLTLTNNGTIGNSIKNIRSLVVFDKLINSVESTLEVFTSNVELDKTVAILTNVLMHAREYQLLHQSFSNKYNIPFQWNVKTLHTSDNYINNQVKISQVQQALVDFPVLKDHLETIAKIVNTIPKNDLILFTPIEKLLTWYDILLLGPNIVSIKNWDNPQLLQDIVEQLNTLQKIHIRLNEVKMIFNKWAIIATEIESTIASQISDRFAKQYRTFLRYLYPQYYKDCQQIASWCNTSAPQRHRAYAEISNSIKDYFRLQNKFKILLSNFNNDYVNNHIDQNQISILFKNMKSVLDWLSGYNQPKVPTNLVQFIKNMDNIQPIENLYINLRDILNLLNTSCNVFQSDKILKNATINDLFHLYPTLQNNIEQTIELYKAVSLVSKAKINDCTINILQVDALQIDKLSSELQNIQQLNLQALFREENIIIAEFVNDPNKLKIIIDDIKILVTQLFLQQSSTQSALQYVQTLKQKLPKFNQWLGKYTKAVVILNKLFENEHSINHLEELELNDFITSIEMMRIDQEGLSKWMTYQRYSNQIKEMEQEWFLKETKDKIITNPSSLFGQALWSAWLEAYYKQKPILQDFNVTDHKQLIAEFKTLEEQVLQVNALRILEMHAPDLKDAQRFGGREEKMLIHQSQLKMRHKPIRKIVRETGKQLLKYKPCWMMSPLTLSSYIPYNALDFDVVIFDEASQMRVEHSLGAIARAQQVIIFGDENQLPPSSFFNVGNNDNEEDEEFNEDYESILHATKEILPGANRLLSHHYRSKYEDLIAFSNHYIYNDQLITFPNPNNSNKAVQFEFVEKGLFDGGKGGGRNNDIEAQRVVEMCIKQITEEPNKSLGVIAFSRAQEVCIRDHLQRYLKKCPHLHVALDETSDAQSAFFIKNLESVQGDERDVIILSVGYGRDKRTGEIYNRFGPINGQHGYRRLNVAVTRAKEKIICVSSIKAADIRNTDKSHGAFILQKYLEYAERGLEALDASRLLQNQQNIELDSPFEAEVERALQIRGYTIHRQIGVSGYKIDLAIVNPENNEEYILGIECDGASYHSGYSARMNDRMRQDILERLGWKLYRIWSQHWISHKEAILNDIIKVVST